MQILIYHGKHGNEYWLAEARAGSPKAIRWVLDRHNDYEYEGWEIIEAIDPCTPC